MNIYSILESIKWHKKTEKYSTVNEKSFVTKFCLYFFENIFVV